MFSIEPPLGGGGVKKADEILFHQIIFIIEAIFVNKFSRHLNFIFAMKKQSDQYLLNFISSNTSRT